MSRMLNAVLIVYTRRKGKRRLFMGDGPVTVEARALQRAADILGGKEQLRAALRVPLRALEEWLAGGSTPPTDVFLKAVDIISGQAGAVEPAAAVRARVRARQSAERIADSQHAVAQARELNEARQVTPRPSPIVKRFLEAAFGRHERLAMLESALDAAIEAAQADMGNVQLKHTDGLHIVAHRGFEEPFLQFFDRVNNATCACGTAIEAGMRIVVRDVAVDQIFVGTEAAKVLEAAGVRAVQSTPLIASSGVVLGMLSTHFSRPHAPGEADLQEIDLIAHRAAFWLEQPTA
jgi:hypothetical protein